MLIHVKRNKKHYETSEWSGLYSSGVASYKIDKNTIRRKSERKYKPKSKPEVTRYSILDLREMILGER